jgi:hypothetical protein
MKGTGHIQHVSHARVNEEKLRDMIPLEDDERRKYSTYP